MPSVRFDRFYRYDELTAILKQYAAEFPQLATIESIGKSHEGRDIWVLTATSKATGPAS
jgi:murein tripeptide amidase MpaA